MRNFKKIILASLITVSSFMALIISTMAFTTTAWFTTILRFNTNTDASSISNYYAGGTGTESDPYLIATPRHVYNFSWLQNSGLYPSTAKTYFKLQNDINMAGTLTGFVGNTSGAVPPIGTDTYPFYGNFDGNGKTIKNLWVSSDPLDWKEKPMNFTSLNVGASIGFFGNIGQNADGSVIGSASHFYLENIEITNKVANSHVGIVGGLVDGFLQAVGVKNAKISLGSSAHQTESEYVLIGKLGPNVEWVDVPADDPGGNLIIDPNNPSNLFTTINYPSVIQVPDSLLGRAYYIGTLTMTSTNINASNSAFLKFGASVTVDPNNNQVIRTDAAPLTTITASNYQNLVAEDYWLRTRTVLNSGRARSVMFGYGTPIPSVNAQGQFNNAVALPAGAFGQDAPRNTIWFKPLVGGKSALSFFRSNQGGDEECISVWSFLRVNGNVTNLRETRFAIIKGTLGNRQAIYFDFIIPQAMAAAGYEFLIGTSSYLPATSAGFFYLSLSGTSEGGGGGNSQIKGVDFTYYTNAGTLEDLTPADYVPKKIHLDFDGVYSGNAYFNMLDYPNNDGKVYFYSEPAGFVINNTLTGTVGVKENSYSTTKFPPRQQTAP